MKRRRRKGKNHFALIAIAAAALVYLTGAYYSCGEYPPGPAEQDDVANGGAAAAGGPCGNKEKTGLPNIYHAFEKIGKDPVATYTSLGRYYVYTDWGYRPDRVPCASAGVIRWRHSTVDWVPDNGRGKAFPIQQHWFDSGCFDGGRQCITKLDVVIEWDIEVGNTIHEYNPGCITTRIGPGGNHWRHVYAAQTCAQVYGRALARSGRSPSRKDVKMITAAKHAYRNWDRAQATIDDFVDRETADRIHRRCAANGFGSARCRQTVLNAYSALSPKVQRRAARAMSNSAPAD
jgi:hypothetical protein